MTKLTLIGMNEYYPNLFSKLTIPADLDRDTLIESILLRSGEFEVLYSDPEFTRDVIGLVSRKWRATFDRWTTALAIEYNPLENYDRFEEWTDSNGRNTITDGTTSSTESGSATGTDTSSGTTSGSEIIDDDTTGSTENEVSAYNESTYEPHDRQTTAGTDDRTTTTSGSTSNTSSTSATSSNTGSGTSHSEADETSNGRHVGRLHGNIGVTTSQQMLESEMVLAEKWANLYNIIADVYCRELIIPIY